MSAEQGIVVDLSRITGPPLIGAFVATALWGVGCMQTLFYFVKYPQDPWFLKTLVTVLWLLDTLHEIFCIYALWKTLIPFGDLEGVIFLQSGFLWQGIVASILAFVARGFFTWRIWRFANKNWIFPIVLVPCSIGDTVATFFWGLKGAGKPAIELSVPPLFTLALAITIIIAVTDTIIAVTMCTLLWRSRTGIVATDRLILRLMNTSVNTGAWTAVFAVFTAIALVIWPRDLFSLLVQFPISAVYCNAVLANLNSRRYVSGSTSLFDLFTGQSVGPGHEIQFQTFSEGISTSEGDTTTGGAKKKDKQRAEPSTG